MDLTKRNKSILSKQSGFTLIEVALVLFILIALLIVFYANSNKSSDLRMARAAIFEATKIAQLAEECRNRIVSTNDNISDVNSPYEQVYHFSEDGSGTAPSFTGNTTAMKSLCGFRIDIPDTAPFAYDYAGNQYSILINKDTASVEFDIPISNYKYPNIATTPSGDFTKIIIDGQKRADNSFRFSNRALMEKKAFFGEKIDVDDN